MTVEFFDIPVSVRPTREAEVPDGKTDHWFTPMKLFLPLFEELRFNVDAAGHAEAPVSCAIGKWFDIITNGLNQDYRGKRVWCNPPYSNIAPWPKKAVESVNAGAVLWALLLPARTDRAWWHDSIEPYRHGSDCFGVEAELRFVKGRQTFGFPGNPHALGDVDSGREPSVVVIFTPR